MLDSAAAWPVPEKMLILSISISLPAGGAVLASLSGLILVVEDIADG